MLALTKIKFVLLERIIIYYYYCNIKTWTVLQISGLHGHEKFQVISSNNLKDIYMIFQYVKMLCTRPSQTISFEYHISVHVNISSERTKWNMEKL